MILASMLSYFLLSFFASDIQVTDKLDFCFCFFFFLSFDISVKSPLCSAYPKVQNLCFFYIVSFVIMDIRDNTEFFCAI